MVVFGSNNFGRTKVRSAIGRNVGWFSLMKELLGDGFQKTKFLPQTLNVEYILPTFTIRSKQMWVNRPVPMSIWVYKL